MNALAEAIESAEYEVAHDPQSPSTTESITRTIQEIDKFLASPEMVAVDQLDLQKRAAIPGLISGKVQRLFEGLRDMLSVAVQTEQLGGHVPWGAALADAIERLESRFARLGVSVDPSKKPPPIVLRDPTSTPDAPSFVVANVTRRPQLEPYIAMALHDARTRELEPGLWYADLEAFPGVWAEGTSPGECLVTLGDVLHEWLIIKVAHGDRDIPVIGRLDPTTLVLG